MDILPDLDRPPAKARTRRPLVVDLDGTLIKSDLLIETAFASLGEDPTRAGAMLGALRGGKARLKDAVAATAVLDPELLPYDAEVLAEIDRARADGREVYLASASNHRLVAAVAEHLGVFTGWMASDAHTNLSAGRKAQRLVEQFGAGGFDYIGNSVDDVPVWQVAATAITVRAPKGVTRRLVRDGHHVRVIPAQPPTVRDCLRLLRVHQYVKNGLVFVPLVTAHAFTLASIVQSVLAAVAFCLCASSVYIINDLADLAADRAHPTKSRRALASGKIPLGYGLLAAPVLLFAAIVTALAVSLPLTGVLLGYFALTFSYSFVLKRKMIVDVVALALLYSIRVFGGAVAIGVPISEWLLTFSVFIFMSLALIKRYVDLSDRLDHGRADPTNRNYKRSDLDIVAALAAASGFNAVTVFALYIASDNVKQLYTQPHLLWLLCPVLIYWISRTILMAHRRHVPDDPIVFALRDRVSYVVLAICLGVLLLASCLPGSI